eukprot:symbB.v1.2.026409.t1/scaffold2636.1/size74350/2
MKSPQGQGDLGMIEVQLSGLAGELGCVSTCRDVSVSELKRIWQEKISVPVDEQRLFLSRRELHDELRLVDVVVFGHDAPGGNDRVELTLVRRSPVHAKLLKLAQDGSQTLNRSWLGKMPEVVRGDVEIVREVLKRDGVALQHASEDLKAQPALLRIASSTEERVRLGQSLP